MSINLIQNLTIEVKSTYLSAYSSPSKKEFLYVYDVKIQNNNPQDVQLLSRHWYIFDSNNSLREVQGEGVIGQVPIIEAGKSYSYESISELKTDMGMMWGKYLMMDCESQQLFEVNIPPFHLITDYRLN